MLRSKKTPLLPAEAPRESTAHSHCLPHKPLGSIFFPIALSPFYPVPWVGAIFKYIPG